MLHREELAGAREAGLDFIRDQKDAVVVAKLSEREHEILRHDVEAAFALHRLDDDRGNARRVGRVLEERLQTVEALLGAAAVIEVRELDVVDVRRKGAVALLVGHDLAGQRHAHEGAAVEATGKRDDAGSPRERARNLDGVFDSFGAGRGEHRFRGSGYRCDRVQSLGQADVVLVGRHLKADVTEGFELFFDGCDQARMLMPGVDHGDARAEVDVAFAVLAPDLGVLRGLGENLRDVADAARNGGNAAGLEFGGSSHCRPLEVCAEVRASAGDAAEAEEFRFEIFLKPFLRALAAEARLLDAAEGRDLV